MLKRLLTAVVVAVSVISIGLSMGVQPVAATALQCWNGSDGHHWCTFWKDAPLEGQSNGLIHKGNNYVFCQYVGATRSEGAWSNNVWLWTLRDKGTGTYGNGYGWVNTLYVSGGANYQGPPTSVVPGCDGSVRPPAAPATQPTPGTSTPTTGSSTSHPTSTPSTRPSGSSSSSSSSTKSTSSGASSQGARAASSQGTQQAPAPAGHTFSARDCEPDQRFAGGTCVSTLGHHTVGTVFTQPLVIGAHSYSDGLLCSHLDNGGTDCTYNLSNAYIREVLRDWNRI